MTRQELQELQWSVFEPLGHPNQEEYWTNMMEMQYIDCCLPYDDDMYSYFQGLLQGCNTLLCDHLGHEPQEATETTNGFVGCYFAN